MPYDPGIAYRGDQYTFQGITGAASALAAGVQDWEKKHAETQQKLETADLLKDYADKKGFTTPEFQAKYAAASANQKADMAAGLSQTIVLQAHDAEQKAEQTFRNAQLAQSASQHAAALKNAMEIAQLHYATAPGTEPGTLVTNPNDPSDIWGQYGNDGKFIPNPELRTGGGGGGDTGVVSSPLLDADKKPVPGKVVVTKPGSNAFSVQDVSQMPDEVQTDPTGNFKWNLRTHTWDVIPGKTARRMQTGSGTDELKMPPTTGQRIMNYLFPPATPSPTPAPGPAVAPVAPGVTGTKQLDAVTASQILQSVGGDPIKARALATQQGYTF